jgi:hypothetical protein
VKQRSRIHTLVNLPHCVNSVCVLNIRSDIFSVFKIAINMKQIFSNKLVLPEMSAAFPRSAAIKITWGN